MFNGIARIPSRGKVFVKDAQLYPSMERDAQVFQGQDW